MIAEIKTEGDSLYVNSEPDVDGDFEFRIQGMESEQSTWLNKEQLKQLRGQICKMLSDCNNGVDGQIDNE